MHVERYGKGAREFFGLHGWSGTHRTFLPLLADMPENVTFRSVDLPGCGLSPRPAAWTLEEVCGEVARAIEEVDAPVTLVGNCSGGNIALFTAPRVQEQIERIVLIDTFAFWPWYFRVFTNRWIGRKAYFTTFSNPLGRWVTNLSLRGKRKSDSHLTDGFASVDHEVTYRYLLLLRDAPSIATLRDLRMPVTLAFGANSFAGVAESAAIYRALWPQAEIHLLDGAGHLPILEATSALRHILFDSKSKETLCPTTSPSYAN